MTAAPLPQDRRDDASANGMSVPRPFAGNEADRQLLNALPIAAGIFRTKGDSLWVEALNSRFIEMSGIGTGLVDVVEAMRRHENGPGGQLIQQFLKKPGEALDELEYDDGDGLSKRRLHLKLAPLDSAADGTSRCLMSVVDRTVETRAEEQLRAEMLRDSLTGLPNRLAFTDMIERAGETASDGVRDDGEAAGHAVLVVDMLRFSRINESMGSLCGDELIITFARRLMSALRAGDQMARTGGNEFGVIVGLKRGIDDAMNAAARIQEVLDAPFQLNDLEIKVECAIGIALMNEERDAEELFRSAQFAVKQAKSTGRPEFYQPEEASLARHRFSIETELRHALDRDQLTMNFQPLIDLKTGEVSGFEALARWHHEDRGPISPEEFIPVAEESGLILQLGRWAMDKAAHTLADWDRETGGALPIYVGVNLSAIQVARDNVADVVSSALNSSGVCGSRLTVELTESSIVQDPRRAQRVFESLKALNATVAMDDFGTGYSSLAYLQRLPIDVLKIDRSFVMTMLEDADNVAIVRAVLSLADALGMSTTAEGIESAELARMLAALGCAHGQGYFFAKPLPEDEALDYWKSRKGKGLAD